MSVIKISNAIFIVGLLVCCVGLVYILGYSKHVFFMYSSGLGFVMLGLGIFVSIFEKSKK